MAITVKMKATGGKHAQIEEGYKFADIGINPESLIIKYKIIADVYQAEHYHQKQLKELSKDLPSIIAAMSDVEKKLREAEKNKVPQSVYGPIMSQWIDLRNMAAIIRYKIRRLNEERDQHMQNVMQELARHGKNLIVIKDPEDYRRKIARIMEHGERMIRESKNMSGV